MMDVTIEYAHIYGNQDPEKEHELAIAISKDLIQSLKDEDLRFKLLIMIDDYNSSMSPDYPQKFVSWLGQQDLIPNYITYESACIPHAQNLISSFTEIEPGGTMTGIYNKSKGTYLYIFRERKIKLFSTVSGQSHYECQLLAAIIDSAKIGIFPLQVWEVNSSELINPKSTILPTADHSVVILPEYYQTIELKAMKILSASVYADILPYIHHIFFKDEIPQIDSVLEEILK